MSVAELLEVIRSLQSGPLLIRAQYSEQLALLGITAARFALVIHVTGALTPLESMGAENPGQSTSDPATTLQDGLSASQKTPPTSDQAQERQDRLNGAQKPMMGM